MAAEREIERLVVRLLGDGRSYQKMMKQAEVTANRTAKVVVGAGKRIEAISKRLTGFGRTLAFRVTLPLVGLGIAAIKVGSDFESGFAGVQKTVDASAKELAVLRKGFKDLAGEVPIAITELLGIGEVAGQLGISTDKILSFTKTIALLGVTTNLSTEEAAISLARFANITGLSQDKISNLGSTIVALGNSLATSEREIVSMATRLAGAGSTIGLTEAQILAFAGALSSVGQQAEAGGTAFSKLFITIAKDVATGGKSLEKFAKVSEKSVEEFSELFRKDASQAVLAFLQGLKNLAPEARLLALEDLKLDAVRMTQAILASVGGIDKLKDALRISSVAFRENTALTKEAEVRFKTFASQITLLTNNIKLLLGEAFEIMRPVLIQIVEQSKKVVEVFRNMSPESKKLAIIIAAVAAAAGPVLLVLGGLTGIVASVVTAIGAMVAGFAGLITAGVALVGLVLTPIGAVLFGIIAAMVGVGFAIAGLSGDVVDFGGIVDVFKNKWSDLLMEFDIVWKGISDAIKGGDIELAVEILWVEIKLLWASGIKDIEIMTVNLIAKLATSFFKLKILLGGLAAALLDFAIAGVEAGRVIKIGDIEQNLGELRGERDKLLRQAAKKARDARPAVEAQKPSIEVVRAAVEAVKPVVAAIATDPKKLGVKVPTTQGRVEASTRGSAEALSRIAESRGRNPMDRMAVGIEKLVELEEAKENQPTLEVVESGLTG